MDKALVMGIGVTHRHRLREPRGQHRAQLDPEQHPHHRPARDHRLAGDRGRPGAEGLPVRAVARALGVRRAHHHQLHRDGSRRGLRDAESAVVVVSRRRRQRPRLRAGAAARGARARADRRRQDLRLRRPAA